MEKEVAGETLFFISPEIQALTMLEAVILEMMGEFYQFKDKNPNNPKVPVQEGRLNKIYDCLDVLNKSVVDSLSQKEEIGRLRWTIANQVGWIKEVEGQLKESKEEIESLKKRLEF